jgi:hypothetical protein
MHPVSFFARSPLRRLVTRTMSVAALCAAAAAAQAAGDGLTISGTPSTSATIGRPYSFTPTVSDPAKRPLHFGIWNKPEWAVFDASTGDLSGTPVVANIGSQANIEIFVSDGVDTATLKSFAITVDAPAADKPTISGTPAASVAVGQTYSFTPTVSNPLLLTVHFGIWNKPSWATFNSSSGHLGGTPTAANVGTQGDIEIFVTDGVDTADLKPFSIKVNGTVTADKPVISGTPAASVVAGSTYKFQPSADDPDGKALTFSVQNKPDWATFSIASGLLDGTPTTAQTGSYGDIIISVSNGQYSSSLPAFTVSVTKPTAGSGSATVDWVPPTENTNGSKLTDLAGVRIYYGTSASNLSQMVQVASTTQTSYTIGNLAAGTWYFGGVAYTTAGTQSAMSSVVSASIP